jgi:hypothetical protein
MNIYCHDCPDQGTELCPVVTTTEQFIDIAKLTGETMVALIMAPGEAIMATPHEQKAHKPVVERIRKMYYDHLAVKSCVDAHLLMEDIVFDSQPN